MKDILVFLYSLYRYNYIWYGHDLREDKYLAPHSLTVQCSIEKDSCSATYTKNNKY